MVEQEILSQFSNDGINPNMIAVYPQGLKGAVSRALLCFSRHCYINNYFEKILSNVTDQFLRAASDPGKENLNQRLESKTSFSQVTS